MAVRLHAQQFQTDKESVPQRGFTKLPNSFYTLLPNLKPAQVAIAMWIVRETFRKHQEWSCPAGYRRIADELGLSKNTVQAQIEAACNSRYFDRVKAEDTFCYKLVLPLEEESSTKNDQGIENPRPKNWDTKSTQILLFNPKEAQKLGHDCPKNWDAPVPKTGTVYPVLKKEEEEKEELLPTNRVKEKGGGGFSSKENKTVHSDLLTKLELSPKQCDELWDMVEGSEEKLNQAIECFLAWPGRENPDFLSAPNMKPRIVLYLKRAIQEAWIPHKTEAKKRDLAEEENNRRDNDKAEKRKRCQEIVKQLPALAGAGVTVSQDVIFFRISGRTAVLELSEVDFWQKFEYLKGKYLACK